MPRPRRSILAAALATALLAGPLAAGGKPSPTPPADGAHPAEPPLDRPLRAAFLVVDGVYNSELVAPYDVLQHTRFHTDAERQGPGIEVFTVSPGGEPVTTFEGLRLVPDHSFETAPRADVLVVPSAEGSMGADLEDETMLAWVRRTAEGARYVVSLCEGAFVLAEAGLLDERAATTFPADYEVFAGRYPDVDLKVNVSFVHDGPFLTSQGGARSYDVAMYLVDLLYGPEVARGVGRGLLIPWPPEPGRVPEVVTDPRKSRTHRKAETGAGEGAR